MTFAESRTDAVQLPNGVVIKVEVATMGREDVGFDVKQFQPVADAIEGMVQMIAAPIQKVKPNNAPYKSDTELR